MKLSVIGIDLAKDLIQVRGSTPEGEKKFKKSVKQKDFFKFMAQQPRSLIGMEACGPTTGGDD